MYTSPEEARSDLLLSGAVYLIGPLLLDILLGIIPLWRIPGVSLVLLVAQPLIVTALTPLLLIRYRGEKLSQYGLTASGVPRLLPGALLALPVVAFTLLGGALDGELLASVPLLGQGPGGFEALAYRLSYWLGLTFLAAYATIKARDAFFSDARSVRDGTQQIGKVLAIIAAVATVLLVVAGFTAWTLVLVPLGVAASVLLFLRGLRRPAGTTKAVLLTPVILLALGPFALTLRADVFVVGVWSAALVAGLGLVIGGLQETRATVMPALGLGLVMAVGTILGPGGYL